MLHYVYDPLCGWCYGAAPLIHAASAVLPVRAYGGGMMAGARRQNVTPQLRAYVMPHDARIAQASGQPFGEAYFNRLLRDETAMFDSEPPIAAMLAAEQLAGRGLDMIARLQTAHYVEGLQIADRAVLIVQAAAIGLDAAAFDAALTQAEGAAVQAHIAATQRFMAQVGATGFPTLLLERHGRFSPIDLGSWLGRPEAWQSWLQDQHPSPPAAPTPMCTPEGCALPAASSKR